MAETKEKKKLEKFTTPVGIVSYPHIAKRNVYKGKEGKYDCTLLLDKNEADLGEMRKRLLRAGKEQFGTDDRKKWPEGTHWPIRNGDNMADKGEMYKGKWVVKFTSNYPITCVNRAREAIDEADVEKEIYAGCLARAWVAADAYDKGVTLYIYGLQKWADGKRIGGFNARDEFDASGDEIEEDDTPSDSEDDEENGGF